MRSRCHLGGQNTKISSSALKSAIHVKSLLSDLSKLLQGSNFYLLSTTLRDLKGGRGSFFYAFEMVGILVFLSVASPHLQGSQLWEGDGRFYKEVFNGPISCFVSVGKVRAHDYQRHRSSRAFDWPCALCILGSINLT